MHRVVLSACIMFFAWTVQAQKWELIVADSVGLDGAFELAFQLENASGDDFQAPDLSEDFEVLSGPNMSSNMSIMNGKMSQSLSYTYMVKARALGTFVIEPATIVVDGEVLESQWKRIVVAEGVKNQSTRRRGIFGGFSFPDMRSMPRFEMPKPELEEEAPKDKQQRKKKKKRKTYKI